MGGDYKTDPHNTAGHRHRFIKTQHT